MFAFETVEAYRYGFQACIQQTPEPLRGQGHAVGHHAPRIAAARNLGAGLFEVPANQHFAAREDNQHIGGIDVRRNLLVEHLQEVGQRHIRNAGVHAAVAAAMAARKVAAQRTLPKERIETVLTHLRSIKIGKNIEGKSLAKPQPAGRHGLFLAGGRVLFPGTFGHGRQRIGALQAFEPFRPGAVLPGRRHTIHHNHTAGKIGGPLHSHRVGVLGLAGLLFRGVFHRCTGRRESQKGCQCKFDFPVHIHDAVLHSPGKTAPNRSDDAGTQPARAEVYLRQI